MCYPVLHRECAERSQILLKAPNDVKEIHFFTKGISFPIAIFTCNDWEKVQLFYLNHNFAKGGFTTLALSKWCINHKIQYQIIYRKR